MTNINISYHKTEISELIIGSYQDKLCLLDYRYRQNRTTIDRRLKKYFKADFVLMEDQVILEAKKQVDQYLTNKRQQFDLPIIMAGTDFQQSVWRELLKLNYGQAVSYLNLAKRVGKPKAVRAVASAVGANALSLVIPCHRVIQTSGGLGGYAGGLVAKKRLLKLEKGEYMVKINQNIKSIIFDMDGVISDTQKLHSKIESQLLSENGVEISPEQITEKYSGVHTEEFFSELLSDKGVDIKELLNKKWQLMEQEINKSGIDEITGSVNLIKALSKKYSLAVASASPLAFIKKKFCRLWRLVILLRQSLAQKKWSEVSQLRTSFCWQQID